MLYQLSYLAGSGTLLRPRLGAVKHAAASTGYTSKLVPQPQERFTFGLSMWKPAPISSSR